MNLRAPGMGGFEPWPSDSYLDVLPLSHVKFCRYVFVVETTKILLARNLEIQSSRGSSNGVVGTRFSKNVSQSFEPHKFN